MLFGDLLCISITTYTVLPTFPPQRRTCCLCPHPTPGIAISTQSNALSCPDLRRASGEGVTALFGMPTESLNHAGYEACSSQPVWDSCRGQCSPLPSPSGWQGFVGAALQPEFFLFPVLLPHFHRCWSLINILHPKLLLSVCFQVINK